MLKNSILYRRLWYFKKRNAGKLHVVVRLATAALIVAVLLTFINGLLIPRLKSVTEEHIKENVAKLAQLTASIVKAGNTAIGDEATSAISDRVSNELLKADNANITIPLIELVKDYKNYVEPAGGPSLVVRLKQAGSIRTAYRTNLGNSLAEQPKQGLALTISVPLVYSGPLFSGAIEVETEVPVEEPGW